jgi:hypothetical protein
MQEIRMTLIASTSIILLINCITVVLFAIHDDDEAHKSAQIINLMEVLYCTNAAIRRHFLLPIPVPRLVALHIPAPP